MFRFRLQKVWRFRCGVRDQEARRLQEKIKNWRDLRQHGQALERDIAALTRWGERSRQKGQNLQLWPLQTSYLAFRRQQLAEIHCREREAKQAVAAQRERLLAARQAVEVLEKLAAKQKQDWEIAELRRSRKEMDEIALQCAARARATGLPGGR